MKPRHLVLLVSVLAATFAAAQLSAQPHPVVPLPVGTAPGGVGHGTPLKPQPGHALAIFSQGCFWGVEYRFRQVPGVVATAVGYTGGHTANPSYAMVSSHGTGHAESVLLEFDPKQVSYQQLLAVFWASHDSTSGDRQGPDRGSQYRSAIFTFGEEQQALALASREQEQRQLLRPITTEVAPAGPFWLAEAEHQQWDERHGYESCPLPQHAEKKPAS
ncbi:MAG: peptide-methionine (S)-S-oxide reductase MsrA [Myxococcaceae bacterium]